MDFVADEPTIDPFLAFAAADDNVVQSFHLDETNLRGRTVRLGRVLQEILDPHTYPEPIALLVAETVTLALLLSSMLKFEGIFTLQTKGDGPVGMLVADVTTSGDVRGCATFDPEKFAQVERQAEEPQNNFARYLGQGYIAFTVDQGEHMERYQGIVALQGTSLVECVQHYFNQSEQIQTGIKMAVARRGGLWRAGGLMLQQMPDEGGRSGHKSDGEEDGWRRSMILMNSCTDAEFLDENLHSNILLARLFHEESVRVFKPMFVQKKCRCSAEKVENVMAMMSDDDLAYMAKDERVSLKCEFCSREFVYDHAEILNKRKNFQGLENQEN